MLKHLLILCAVFWLLPASLTAAVYQVSPSGSDSAAGSAAAPWRTLQHAALTVGEGDTVEVRGGSYEERVTFARSGTAAAPIVFRAFPGEVPVVEGSALTPPPGASALFRITGISYVRIEGFELRNYRTALKDRVPVAILVNGSGEGIRLENNHIHNIETNYTGRNGGDAHGLAVFGDSNTPVSGIVIRHNHLHDLKLGSSEALVLNGNVVNFLVEGNRVHDCNNIGIDCIGHEGTAPTAELDAARDGIVRGNQVSNITSAGNPAYGSDTSADGIYVDGGRDILIERNTVTKCDIGIECASERAGLSTSRITVRNNAVFENLIGGIFLGGYDTQRGFTEGCIVEHNTLWNNDTKEDGNGEIFLQFDVRDSSFRNNIIFTGRQGLVVGNPYTQNTRNTLDYNLVSTPAGVTPEWQWKKQYKSGLAAWRTFSGQGANSFVADPRLVDPVGGDFGLRPKSPAINAADPAFVPAVGELDLAGKDRIAGARSDLGAREFDLAGFAFGESSPPPELSLSGSAALLSFTRRTDWAAQSLAFAFQTSANLQPGGWSPVGGSLVGTAASGPTERVTFSFPLSRDPRWFLRVKVTVN